MDLKVQMIQDFEDGESVTALSEVYGVSRKTIYKWLARHDSGGVAGLAEFSRAPHHRPQTLSREMIQRIVEARQHWRWGPRKLRLKLQELEPETDWPAASTIADVLLRLGLSHKRKKRARTPDYQKPFAHIEQPNQTWCADFKGWIRTRDGTRCDPLTITDAFSRYLLRCQIVPKTDTLHVAAIFDAAFREYGLPEVIRTDNGAPFASRAPGGLSRLSMRWVKLGIQPERTRRASPQDNARHERMHLTLKQETMQPPAATPRRQQEQFHEFQQRYNHQRPHEGLKDRKPADCYAGSPRAMPRRVPALEYPDHMMMRWVSEKGELRWKNDRIFISEIFGHEPLGVQPLNDRYAELRFGPVGIGWLDGFRSRFHRSMTARMKRDLGLWKPPEA